MATAKYLMQAKDSIAGLVTWRSTTPDWSAAGAPAVGTIDVSSVAVSGGGFDIPDSGVPDKAITLTDGSYVTLTDGSYATTT